jgi:hypothetical protein
VDFADFTGQIYKISAFLKLWTIVPDVKISRGAKYFVCVDNIRNILNLWVGKKERPCRLMAENDPASLCRAMPDKPLFALSIFRLRQDCAGTGSRGRHIMVESNVLGQEEKWG